MAALALVCLLALVGRSAAIGKAAFAIGGATSFESVRPLNLSA